MSLHLSMLGKWLTSEQLAALQGPLKVQDSIVFKGDIGGSTRVVVWPRSRPINEFLEKLYARLSTGSIQNPMLVAPPKHEATIKEWLERLNLRNVSLNVSPFCAISVEAKSINIRSNLKVVNVDDSPVILKLLERLLAKHKWIEILTQFSDPTLAEEAILKLDPDIVTMDIQMPGLTGVELLKRILPKHQLPIIMVSGLGPEDGPLVFEALDSGAAEYIQKPTLESQEDFMKELVQKSLWAACNPLERRRSASIASRSPNSSTNQINQSLLWCIGASTGGPPALTRVLTSLPRNIPPTLIVQHIPPVYSKSMAESLDRLCPFRVKEAEHGESIQSGCVYIAPGGKQMKIEQHSAGLKIVISDDPPVNRFKPSVDYLFENLSKLKLPLIAGVMTGMGKDGAAGLLALKESGAITFAQDEDSSVVYGMPRAAAENGAASSICSLDDIADFFVKNSLMPSHRKIA
jgi:two-component system, chemotaxis family, protein-glutamate methylesterase/glutaminase